MTTTGAPRGASQNHGGTEPQGKMSLLRIGQARTLSIWDFMEPQVRV